MEHAILHENIDGQRVDFYPETGFDDVVQTDGDDEITLRMVLEGMDAAIALVQNGLAKKANAADVYTKTNLYTKTETNNLLSGKANKATTLAGYGITDTYTKTEVDNYLTNYLPLSGGTMSGWLTTQSNDARLRAVSTSLYGSVDVENNIGTKVNLMVGSGGENRGVYDSSDVGGGKWLIYNDNNGYPKLNQSPLTSDNSTQVATTSYVRNALKAYSAMPKGTNRIEFTPNLSAWGADFVAPCDGWVSMYVTTNSNIYLVNDTAGIYSEVSNGKGVFIPATKGDSITCHSNDATPPTIRYCHFVYAKSEV